MPREGKIPTSTLCPCGNTFQQPTRPQGGGKRTIYCSAKCRAREWARGNKNQAQVTGYETRRSTWLEENKDRLKEYRRDRTLAQYGLTKQSFAKMLVRQQFSCAGCLKELDDTTAKVDHCHETGKIRGLLCNTCNLALGATKDDPMILRRLMAYLERDPDKKMVYLAGALKNPRIVEIGNSLRGLGYDVMDEWWTPGKHADENWQAYEGARGRTYKEALEGRSASNVFMFDRAYLDLADAVVLVMPAGKSAMLELGYVLGRGKRAFIFLDDEDPDRYDVMPKFASGVAKTLEELVFMLEEQ